jgi:hypothetical protein
MIDLMPALITLAARKTTRPEFFAERRILRLSVIACNAPHLVRLMASRLSLSLIQRDRISLQRIPSNVTARTPDRIDLG